MTAQKIAIVDYNMGNLRSVYNALAFLSPKSDIQITHLPDVIEEADRIVIPGQGAARDCMEAMQSAGVKQRIAPWIASGKPIFGICMGMQLLFDHSSENEGVDCLGIYGGTVRRFETDPSGDRKVPQMGWNAVEQREHPLWHGIENNAHFYFAHSYYLTPSDDNISVGLTDYGRVFTSAIARDNVFACQFHPEKSADAGLQLIKNFLNWNPVS